MMIGIFGIAVLAFLIVKQVGIRVWTMAFGLMLLIATVLEPYGMVFKIIMWSLFAVLLLVSFKLVRVTLLSKFIFSRMRRLMPAMSLTERVALEAGTVGWDAELFSGSPNFDNLLANQPVELSNDDRSFLEGPVNELCRLLDDWDITHHHTDLPTHVWQFIKKNGFLGMMIPKQYGGLELSATAQTAVLVKLYGRSVTAATTVSVPNSLGPAELLLKYGTEAQKNYYLPRLARGLDIPCFALTGPNAGSDAASIPDTGIVCYETLNAQKVLGVRLNWDKRYITLCPVATVIGLAFRLFDPENLLGKGEDIGITCALIPAETPGVKKGRRHFPLNTAFLNGPTQGKDVFVSMDA